jgi:ubiquinone/menaquinone biosynthesis C-methylase UbiE
MPDPEQWQLSGNAAEQYEKIPARYILGPWALGLVEAAELQRDEKILDLACGTGVVTRAAAAKLGPAGHITGLDLNEGMLKVAMALGNPGVGGLAWVRGSALEMDLPDAGFDLVLCQQGLQFFPDQHKALSETHRVLRDGGRAWFSIWAEAGPYQIAVGAAIATHVDESTARRYKATRDVPDADSLRSQFSDAGFRQVDITRKEMQMRLPEIKKFIIAQLRSTPFAEAIESLSASDQAALAQDAAEELSPYADGVDAVVPDSINLVSAKK